MTLAKLGSGFIAFLVILLMVSIPTQAAERYNLQELDMGISLPADGYIITRDIKADDPLLEQLERNWEEEIEYLEENSIYLEFIHEDPYYDIDVSMAASDFAKDIVNLNLFDEDYLNQMGQFYVNSEDAKYSSYRLHSVDDIDFIVLRGRQTMNKKKSNIEDYYTIYNGQEISIALYSYEDKITDEMAVQLQQVANSIVLDPADELDNSYTVQTLSEIGVDETKPTEALNTTSPPLLGSDENNEKIHQTLLWIAISILAVMMATIIIVIVRSRKKQKNATDQNNNDNKINEKSKNK